MTLANIIDQTDLQADWENLGGLPLKRNRARAQWRGGDGWSVQVSPHFCHDHATGATHGVLETIALLNNCSRRDAAQLLARYHGLELDGSTPAARADWRRRRSAAEAAAADLLAWRERRRRDLIDARNNHWDTAACGAAVGRLLLAARNAATESEWGLVWSAVSRGLRGDTLQAEIETLEAVSPRELIAWRAAA